MTVCSWLSTVMASLHRATRRDKTVESSRDGRCELGMTTP